MDIINLSRRNALFAISIIGAQFSANNILNAQPNNKALKIVFFHGFDANIEKSFGKIIPYLKAKHQILAINRKGYGQNIYNNEPRDGLTIANEIKSALDKNNIAPPYLLVGHSLGAVYADFFARIFSKQTNGLILIDPMVEGQDEFLSQNYSDAYGALNLMFLFAKKAIKNEFTYSKKLYGELNKLPKFANKTIILMANKIAGLENPENYLKFRHQKLQKMAIDYNCELKIFNSGHFIQNEFPNDIINLIENFANS